MLTHAIATVAVIPARDKDESHEVVSDIVAWLRRHGCATATEDELRSGRTADAVVALGGDGLMMRMAHSFPGVPLLGINFGKVGFLAMVERSGWEEALTNLLQGEFSIQDGPTLQCRVRRDGIVTDGGWAINDVVVRSGIQMIDVELYIDGRFVNTYPSDGMIVASPQGSTAYCMAAGGPILTFGVHGFAVTPISPHSPIRATMVVPEESEIEMAVASERDAFLILDGQLVDELRRGDVVSVSKGVNHFRLIVTEQTDFYQAFQSKFNYLIRPGAVPSLGHERHEP
ncbi:MAG TPA: NAD(+)/NADH kinase [Thermomicrobiales bacterium]|nr:NAD(+)/NADH kinase [Thermomicrobiales bacterium]